MSVTQQGPDWWHATDGLWYPAERHPNYRPPAVGEGTQPVNGQSAPTFSPPDQETVVRRLNEQIIRAMDEGLGTHQILELCEARAWVLSPDQPHGFTAPRP
jgi:hypothetical protein